MPQKIPIVPLCLLTQIQVGESGTVSHLQAEPSSIDQIKRLGICIGVRVTVQGVTSQGDMLITTQDGEIVNLSAYLAGTIWIQKAP